MNKYKKDELVELIINQKKSYESVGRKYGVSGSAIKNAAKRFGINLEQRRLINKNETFNKNIKRKAITTGICLSCGKTFVEYSSKENKYCSVKCQHDYQHKEIYKNFLNGNSNLRRGNYSCAVFKPDILIEQNNKCDICGLENIWNNKALVFILDHIDGDASHNTRDNLRLVCPNCDSQLETYKSKNKNGARHQYRYKN